MPNTVAGTHLSGNHAGRPAGNAVPDGTLYSCSTHSLIYVSSYAGNSWSTWATLGSAASGSITASGYTQATARLLGRTTASSGAIEEISVGSGLTLSGGSLSATGGGGGAPTTTPYVTAAADGSLSAEVVIPGLAGSPDRAAGGGNDDEFDTTDSSDPMTGWTTLGSPTAHDMNSTAKSHYYVKRTGGASAAWSGIIKAVPSMPFTVTAKMAAMLEIPTSNSLAGLVLGEASPGKLLTYSLINYLGRWCLFPQLWTNPTTYNTSMGTSYPLSSAWGDAGVVKVGGPPIWLRLVVNSSSSVDFFWSMDGLLFNQHQLAQNPAFTIGTVGLGVERGGNSKDIAALFDWIRFS